MSMSVDALSCTVEWQDRDYLRKERFQILDSSATLPEAIISIILSYVDVSIKLPHSPHAVSLFTARDLRFSRCLEKIMGETQVCKKAQMIIASFVNEDLLPCIEEESKDLSTLHEGEREERLQLLNEELENKCSLITPQIQNALNTYKRLFNRELSFEELTQKCKSLERLSFGRDVVDCSLISVNAFSHLACLTELSLSDCPTLTNVSFLRSIPNLTTLSLNHCMGLTTMKHIGTLRKLTELNLVNCCRLEEEDMSALSPLLHLRELNLLYCTGFKSLEGIETLNNLTSLDMSGCTDLTNLSALRGLDQLTQLNISECSAITDICILHRLNRLTTLDLTGCENIPEEQSKAIMQLIQQ